MIGHSSSAYFPDCSLPESFLSWFTAIEYLSPDYALVNVKDLTVLVEMGWRVILENQSSKPRTELEHWISELSGQVILGQYY